MLEYQISQRRFGLPPRRRFALGVLGGFGDARSQPLIKVAAAVDDRLADPRKNGTSARIARHTRFSQVRLRDVQVLRGLLGLHMLRSTDGGGLGLGCCLHNGGFFRELSLLAVFHVASSLMGRHRNR